MALDEELAIYRQIVELYKTDFMPIVEGAQDELTKLLEEELGKEKLLYNRYAATQSRRFSVVGRAKKPDSLSEKLIRTSQGLELIDDISGLSQVIGHTQQLRQRILGLKDALGIKIICDLYADTGLVFRVVQRLARNKEWVNSTNLFLNHSDLQNQPQQMANGRPIYRIKGEFLYRTHRIGIELQIKSRLTDAWGEIEHPMFYKNHQITLVRDVLQLGMNHVGSMLDSIDRYLLDLRLRAERNLDDDADLEIRFFADLYNAYGKKLEQMFPQGFTLQPIQWILFHSHRVLQQDDLWVDLRGISEADFTLQAPTCTTARGRAIESAWRNNYHVRVLFAILSHWRTSCNLRLSDDDLVEVVYRSATESILQEVKREIDRVPEETTWLDNVLELLLDSAPPTQVLGVLTEARRYVEAIQFLELSNVTLGESGDPNTLATVLALSSFEAWKQMRLYLQGLEPDIIREVIDALGALAVGLKNNKDLASATSVNRVNQALRITEEAAK